MKHYGTEPPWNGRSRYGSWERGATMWDGSTEWVYVPPSPFADRFSVELAGVMKDAYLDTIRTTLAAKAVIL